MNETIEQRLAEKCAALVGKIGWKEALDIRFWYAAVHDVGCPNCGVDFPLHPEANLYPHFTGACGPKR